MIFIHFSDKRLLVLLWCGIGEGLIPYCLEIRLTSALLNSFISNNHLLIRLPSCGALFNEDITSTLYFISKCGE